MTIIKHAEGIYEIEEFLTKDQQQTFLLLCNDEGWVKSNPGNITKSMDNSSLIEADNVASKISDFFINMDSYTPINRLRRLKFEERMYEHIDGGDPTNPKPIVFGIAIYLNDDFTGGELVYPDLNLSITPKARSMVIHDAKLKHAVNYVTSGNRYSITTFILGNEFTKITLN
jgi:hypothetical protein